MFLSVHVDYQVVQNAIVGREKNVSYCLNYRTFKLLHVFIDAVVVHKFEYAATH